MHYLNNYILRFLSQYSKDIKLNERKKVKWKFNFSKMTTTRRSNFVARYERRRPRCYERYEVIMLFLCTQNLLYIVKAKVKIYSIHKSSPHESLITCTGESFTTAKTPNLALVLITATINRFFHKILPTGTTVHFPTRKCQSAVSSVIGRLASAWPPLYCHRAGSLDRDLALRSEALIATAEWTLTEEQCRCM